KEKRRTPLPVRVPGSDATVDLSDHGPHKHARAGRDFESPEALLKARRAARGEADRPWPPAYILETARKSEFTLGDAMSLAGATYVVQTLFAATFPALARSGAMRTTIGYTDSVAQWLRAIDAARETKGLPLGVFSTEVEHEEWDHPAVVVARQAVKQAVAATGSRHWQGWSWEDNAPHAQDEFGLWHRVVVGVDGTDGLIYGRVRFFGSLELVMLLGRAPGHASAQSTYHINPFAHEAEGSQIIERTMTPSARPTLTDGELVRVPTAIGMQQLSVALAGFNRRREAYVAAHAAGQWLERFAKAGSAQETSAIARAIWSVHIQNVSVHLTRAVQVRLLPALDATTAERLRQIVARDDTAASGVSREYEGALQAACHVLEQLTIVLWSQGRLDRDIMANLLNGDIGRTAVGQAIDVLVRAGGAGGAPRRAGTADRPTAGIGRGDADVPERHRR
ncbi:hypothetical protein, partial [Pandoraea sputorum]